MASLPEIDPSSGWTYLAAVVGLVANAGLSLGFLGGLLVPAACYIGLSKFPAQSETERHSWPHDAIIIGPIHGTFWGMQQFGLLGVFLALVYIPLRLLVAPQK